MKLDVSLQIAEITKHQYYYQPKGTKQGKKQSLSCLSVSPDGTETTVLNAELVPLMQLIHQDPDTDYGYRKMTAALKIMGFL